MLPETESAVSSHPSELPGWRDGAARQAIVEFVGRVCGEGPDAVPVVAHLAQRPATPRRSYGLLRLEILAALVNGALLIVIAAGIGIEASRRLRAPPEVNGGLMLGIAALGLAVNLASVGILHAGHRHSLNERGAYLHVLSDALGALGALVAAGVIVATGATIADPIVSALIALLILLGA